jgi:hypothetical protein
MPAKTTTAAAAAKPAARKRTTTAAAKPRTRRRKPTHHQIAQRAYFLSLGDGGADEFGNWLRAERELAAA